MKKVFRSFFFSLYALIVTTLMIDGIDYGYSYSRNFLLFVSGLFLLNLFIRSILNIISLPTSGIWFIVLSFVINVCLFIVLITFLPDISILEKTTLNLNIGDNMLTSYELEAVPTVLLSALVFTLFFRFLTWISESKK